MAPKISPNFLLLAFFIMACLLPSMISSHGLKVAAENNYGPKIKGMFVFGSSLVDNGNNNFLQNSLAKANFFPYGIDFPLGHSGRFTNGKNVIDLLSKLLKFPTYIPAFADPSTKGRKILFGVNYASGASGILDDTGAIAGNVFTLNQQIQNFENVTLPDLEMQLSHRISRKFVGQCLFVLGTGGNDYSFNYFLSKVGSNRLYDLGARKFVLMSVNPNGCTPMAKAMRSKSERCIESINRAIQLFNTNLRTLVDKIKQDLPGSNLVSVNSYKIIRDIIKDPASKGFIDAKNSCCQVPSIIEGGTGTLCKQGGTTCPNRSTHVFFDGLHPSEAVNVIIANKAYNSHLRAEVYPMNVKRLTEI